ncbi:hypothetical protein CPB86DRAFT_61499 [Serendipita vermifera]|nr:hypothetical protein CPB86DRAFT_61499 [Serendipita vermifera]
MCVMVSRYSAVLPHSTCPGGQRRIREPSRLGSRFIYPPFILVPSHLCLFSLHLSLSFASFCRSHRPSNSPSNLYSRLSFTSKHAFHSRQCPRCPRDHLRGRLWCHCLEPPFDPPRSCSTCPSYGPPETLHPAQPPPEQHRLDFLRSGSDLIPGLLSCPDRQWQ